MHSCAVLSLLIGMKSGSTCSFMERRVLRLASRRYHGSVNSLSGGRRLAGRVGVWGVLVGFRRVGYRGVDACKGR